jgi:hypothetical protein
MEDKDQELETGPDKVSDKPWWSEMVKELTLSGLATVFMTEDSIRGYLKDKKMPKELVSLVMEGLSRKKDDFYGLMAKEFGRVLSKIDLSKEIGKFMETHQMSLKISFEKKKDSNDDSK